jgi:4-hydroxythreonine-4-phosphate dehydrogenase
MSKRPRIAVTMGDPAGVGPELALRLLNDPEIAGLCIPIVFGSAGVLERAGRAAGLGGLGRLPVLGSADWRGPIDGPAVLDLAGLDPASVTPGHVDASTGAASFLYVDRAIDAALAGRVDAVCTGPIHKEAFAAAGVPYPGHTELFAARTRAEKSAMMLTSDAITCALVTAHVGLFEVPGLLTVARIVEVMELAAEAMARLRGRPARLAVCGLNPHAGEHGLFGRGEEEALITPAIAEGRSRGLLVEGPFPPDTAFLPARRERTDAYICMYHDQGLIPLKMLAFDSAVNVTLGLPIVRTSVDHGTALDLAWQGTADPSSLLAAVRLAARLAGPR